MCCPCRTAAVGAMRSGLPSLQLVTAFLNPFASDPLSSLLLWRPWGGQRGRGSKEGAKWTTQVLNFAAFWGAKKLHRTRLLDFT